MRYSRGGRKRKRELGQLILLFFARICEHEAIFPKKWLPRNVGVFSWPDY